MNVYHVISNKEWGGGEQYALDLCRRLKADGHHVEVFCRPVKQVEERLRSLDVPLHRLPLKGVLDGMSACRMARTIGREPCVVHVHNFKDAFTACYARIFGGNQEVKVVVTRHLVRSGKNSWVYKWLYRQMDRIIFVSQKAQKAFLSTHPAIDEAKLRVVRNSIVTDVTEVEDSVRETYGIPADGVLAMYHGRLAAEKGLDVLVDAMAKVRAKNLCLLLIGRGDAAYTTALKQKVAALRLAERVFFGGFKKHVMAYVRQADFGVVPSVVAESSSLACMEYLSQGKCVVTTNNGGQAEYIAHGVNGWLVPPADIDALAEALTKAAADKDRRETLGKQAKEDFRTKLSYEVFYQKILSVYAD